MNPEEYTIPAEPEEMLESEIETTTESIEPYSNSSEEESEKSDNEEEENISESEPKETTIDNDDFDNEIEVNTNDDTIPYDKALKQKLNEIYEIKSQRQENKPEFKALYKGLNDRDKKYLKSISAKPYETINYNKNYSENFVNPLYEHLDLYYNKPKHTKQITIEDQICDIAKLFQYDLNKIRKYINKLPIGINVNCRELNNRIPLPNEYKFRMANQKLLIAKKCNMEHNKSKNLESSIMQNSYVSPKIINEMKTNIQTLANQLDAILELYRQEDPTLHSKLLNIYKQILEQRKNN
jgi:hypothetical protein